MITFSNIVRDVRATENNDNVQNCNIEFKPDKKATKSESVGLDINLVTSPIEENKNFETSEKANLTESVTFSGLVRQDNKSSEKKFGIQASSDDDSMLPDYMDSNNMIENAIKAATTVQPVNVSYNKSVRKNNWFTRICDQKGEDYITSGKIRVDEINADKILDEMINGRIDYSKQGHLVMTPIIIETLIGYCSNKLSISKALQFSLCYLYNDINNTEEIKNTDPNRFNTLIGINDGMRRNIAYSISIINQDIGVYETLYNKLSYAHNMRNISGLYSLTNELKVFKNMMKHRY